MQLIAPDIISEAHGLSVPFAAAGVAIAVLLWILGWRWHRFWVVLATTVAAGLVGLSTQQAIGPRMLAAGVLLALAAGMMAIDLSRLLAFGSGGLAAWLIVHKVLPNFNEPLICFLLGGILGIFLYRLQLMVLTSFTATLLFGHSAILLFEKLNEGRFDAMGWVQANTLGLTIAVVVVTLAGVAVQGQYERWRDGADGRRRSWLMSYLTDAERETLQQAQGRRSAIAALFNPR
jgi:hypothetical protein